jgi:4-amino-4-deoxy-L-arabinose transferase-like glycosyltransferase
LVTRLYKISDVPASVYWDEASIGYNAYSVLVTGKDEWGETLPLHFRAFGEFKLPVYVYSVLLSEFLFGLSVFSVRLPAVVFGILSVVGVYLLSKEISKNKTIGLISSFLFSITPWFFIFSRTGYEATAGLAFFIFAIYFLIRSFGKDKRLLIVSTLLFIVSMYSYNSFRILTPLVLGPVFAYHLYKRKFLVVLLSVLFLGISMVPVYKLYVKDSGLSRLEAVGSKRNIISNYFKNFSPNYLFNVGDQNPRSQVPNDGQLYYLDILFLALGTFFILKSKNKNCYWILWFLIISPIPAAITKENPHALRSILTSPILSIVSGLGVYYLSSIYLKKQKEVIFIAGIFYLISFSRYYYFFITNYNSVTSSAWQYEYKEIFSKQKSGCVSDEYAQPYIFALFYDKVDPKYFISTKKLNTVSDWGFSTVASFGKYSFSKKCNE